MCRDGLTFSTVARINFGIVSSPSLSTTSLSLYNIFLRGKPASASSFEFDSDDLISTDRIFIVGFGVGPYNCHKAKLIPTNGREKSIRGSDMRRIGERQSRSRIREIEKSIQLQKVRQDGVGETG